MIKLDNNKQLNIQSLSQSSKKNAKCVDLSFSSQELAQMTSANYRAHFVPFVGKKSTKNSNSEKPTPDKENFETFVRNKVKTLKGKNNIGASLYIPSKNNKNITDYINWEKVGWEHLQNEPIDWKNATEKDIYAFWHALSLAETNDTTWPRRFNPRNVKEPLATYRSISGSSAKNNSTTGEGHIQLHNKLVSIKDSKINKLLDLPIINPDTGKLNFNFTVFDTETTGINITSKRPPFAIDEDFEEKETIDKIIQIGALKFNSNGEIVKGSGISQLINPEMPIPEQSTDVHGIRDVDIKGKPVIDNVLKPFLKDYLGHDIIVAYNAKFDLKLLNNAIDDYNEHETRNLNKKELCVALDPFILIQRIHPYLGSKKQLSEQYKFLFGQNLEGAHDAFADVKATADVLKYCLFYLSEKAKQKGNSLTLRDVLRFQFGYCDENKYGIKLNERGLNAAVRFDESYDLRHVGVHKFLKGFKITQPTKFDKTAVDRVKQLKELIGEENLQILKDGDLINAEINDVSAEGFTQNPAETLNVKNSPAKSLINRQYIMKENFKNVLLNIGIKEFGGKSKDEIIDLIIENSKHYINEQYIDIWMKNPNPSDIAKGNDLPQIDIAKKVMLERLDSEGKAAQGNPLELLDSIKSLKS